MTSIAEERTSTLGRQPTSQRVRRVALTLGIVLLWAACVLVTIGLIYNDRAAHSFGKDSHAYWLTGHRSTLYGLAPGKSDAYLYSPVFAQAIQLLALLPWVAFMWIWAAIEFSCFVWLLKPLPRRWSIPLLMICGMEAITGDIYGLLGLVAVLGLRRPALWALPLLTKIVPGLGVAWFAIRREWRQVAWAAASTAVLAGISLALAPHLWWQWYHFLIGHRGESTVAYPLRLPIGIAALIIGARTNRKWLLAVALMFAMPMAGNLWTLTMLAPIPRLRELDRRAGASDSPEPVLP